MEMIKKNGFNKGDLIVFDSIIFMDAEKAFLVSVRNGTTLCMTLGCAEELIREEVSDDLAFVLIQRGMASYRASRPVSHYGDRVFPSFS